MAQVEAVWEGKEPGMVGIEAVEDLIDDLTGAIEN